MPGGDTRSVSFHRPYPLMIARGAGPFVWDADGNRYIDLLGSYRRCAGGCRRYAGTDKEIEIMGK